MARWCGGLTEAVRRHGLILVLPWLVVACAQHVRLQVPDTSPGARYRCQKQSSQCAGATTDVPSELNPYGTTSITLPRQCKGRIHQVMILDADSSNPVVDVTCAPEEPPIEEMK
jgi:hypothetical protein